MIPTAAQVTASLGGASQSFSVMLLTGGCALQQPAITKVQSAGAYGALTSFASGSWLEIYGSNLASTTRQWTQSDFNGPNAPVSLDGTSVLIGGKPGFVWFIKADDSLPGQINVQAPADATVGPVAIVVTNCAGTSAPYVLRKSALAPGMLAPPDFDAGGKQYLLAVFSDGATYVGNPGLVAGVPFRPAKPGDNITAYGIGFGDVAPETAPGVVVSQANQIANSFTILFGQTAASVSYYGLAPGSIGLYQFNLTVPDVPDGDAPITVNVGGVQAQQGLFLTVHQ
jgi:uncharacterized protein (TIGR03437 family)